MINRKNKPVNMGLDINRFVNEVQQNKRPAESFVKAEETIRPEEVADTAIQQTSSEAAPEVTKEEKLSEEAAMNGQESEKEPQQEVSSVTATNENDTEDAEEETLTEQEEKPKRKRTVPQKAVKRDKLVGVKFDKKTHKELSRIKIDYDIDIQDFIYAAVLRLKEQYFPNNKATKEGLDIIREQIDKVNGNKQE